MNYKELFLHNEIEQCHNHVTISFFGYHLLTWFVLYCINVNLWYNI